MMAVLSGTVSATASNRSAKFHSIDFLTSIGIVGRTAGRLVPPQGAAGYNGAGEDETPTGRADPVRAPSASMRGAPGRPRLTRDTRVGPWPTRDAAGERS